MCIDWNLVVNSITAVATLGGVVIAGIAMNTWRRQNKAKLAEEVIVTAYTLGAIIAAVRSPMSYGGEGSSRTPDANESADDKRRLDLQFVPLERLNHFRDKLAAVYPVKLRADLHFPDASKELDNLLKIINSVRASAQGRYGMKGHEDREIYKRFESEVWEFPEDKDVFLPKIKESIQSIEKSLKRYL